MVVSIPNGVSLVTTTYFIMTPPPQTSLVRSFGNESFKIKKPQRKDELKVCLSDFEKLNISNLSKRSKRRLRETYGDFSPQSGLQDVIGNADSEFVFQILEKSFIMYKIFMNVFRSCRTRKGMVSEMSFGVLVFSSMFTNKSVTGMFMKSSKGLHTALIAKLEEVFEVDTEALTPQDGIEDFFNQSREHLDSFAAFKQSPLYTKVYKFVLYALSFSLFSKAGVDFSSLGFRKVEEEAVRRKYSSRFDFAEVCADTLLYLCQTGYQIMKTGEIQPIFHSATSYEKWYLKFLSIKKQANYVHAPLVYEEVFGTKFVESTFLRDVRECIEQGEAICRYGGKMGAFEKTKLRGMVDSMHMIQCELLTTTKAMENREEPFSLLIYGDSKIGKSAIKDMLRIHFAKKQNLGIDPSYCYTVSPTDKHWTNFSSEQHTLVMDDVAFLNPKHAPNGDPTVMNLLQVINGVPFMPEQAALEKKGRTPLRAKLVIATTNTEDLNAHYYFSCPSAVQRRFPYIIIPRVKPEFADRKGFLDSSKVIGESGDYPDRWTWTVKKVDPVKVVDVNAVAQKKASMTTILDKVTLKEFLLFYNKAIEDHDKVVESMAVTTRTMEETVLCQMCYMPPTLCDCPQFGNETYVSDPEPMTDFVSVMSTAMGRTRLFVVIRLLSAYLLTFIETAMGFLFGIFFWIPFFFGYWERVRHWIAYKLTVFSLMFYFNNSNRAWVRALGRRVQGDFQTPIILASIVGALSAAAVLIKIRKTFSGDPQAGISAGVSPKPLKKERDNVWYSADYEVSCFDLSPTITSNKQLSVEDYVSMLQRNCVYLDMEEGKTKRFTRAFCLKGQFYGINNHVLEPFKEGFRATIVMQREKAGVTQNVEFFVSMEQIQRFPERDFAILYLPNLPPKKNIVQHFPKKEYRSETSVLLLGRTRAGGVDRRTVHSLRKDVNARLSAYNIVATTYMGKVSTPTVPGDCGSLYVSFSKLGPAIVGFHSLGHENITAAIALDRDYIENCLINFSNVSIQSGQPQLEALSAKLTLEPLSGKSVFRYMEEGTASVHGSFSGFKNSLKSRVVKTTMNEHLANHGYLTLYTQPTMKGYLPWRIAGLDMVNPVSKLDYSLLRRCKENYVKSILDFKLDLSVLEVYDDFTTVNGCAGVAYVDKINRTTSAGLPHKCSKKRFLKPCVAVGGNMDPVEVSSEIWDLAHEILEKYLNGERAHPLFCAHLKDEAVTIAKANMGKTRVFTGAPFSFSLVVRKYLLSACRLVQTNRFAFESAPGTIAQSPEWGDIYTYLTSHGENQIVAGDYSKFDKRMSAMLILLAFEILIDLCKISGNYTDDDVKILWGIAYDTAFPNVDFNGDLVEFYGSNPSGHPLTVIINGLVNSLYVRYCYLNLNPNKDLSNFKDLVKLMTYGDDNIMGISPTIPWFNHTAISRFLGSVDIGYTMADKEAESVPYINIKDATFLKRGWRFDDDVGGWLCPLDHESIEKSLMVCVRSKSLWAGEQNVEIVSSAMREYFFYGRDIYEQKKILFLNMLNNVNCSHCNPVLGEHKIAFHIKESTFPEWRSFYDKFHSYALIADDEEDHE